MRLMCILVLLAALAQAAKLSISKAKVVVESSVGNEVSSERYACVVVVQEQEF
jgi:hypothetical protein